MSGKPNDKWLATMIQKHGSIEAVKDVQRTIGRKGGQNGTTGGFAANPALARIAGRKGGLVSGRKWKKAVDV